MSKLKLFFQPFLSQVAKDLKRTSNERKKGLRGQIPYIEGFYSRPFKGVTL